MKCQLFLNIRQNKQFIVQVCCSGRSNSSCSAGEHLSATAAAIAKKETLQISVVSSINVNGGALYILEAVRNFLRIAFLSSLHILSLLVLVCYSCEDFTGKM